MCRDDLSGRQNLLAIAGIVCGDLRDFGAAEPTAGDSFDDLLATRTGGIKVLLRETLNLRCAALARFDLVAKRTELIG